MFSVCLFCSPTHTQHPRWLVMSPPQPECWCSAHPLHFGLRSNGMALPLPPVRICLLTSLSKPWTLVFSHAQRLVTKGILSSWQYKPSQHFLSPWHCQPSLPQYPKELPCNYWVFRTQGMSEVMTSLQYMYYFGAWMLPLFLSREMALDVHFSPWLLIFAAASVMSQSN